MDKDSLQQQQQQQALSTNTLQAREQKKNK